MGLMNWCGDRWLKMMRTKPQYISILGRKRSSVNSPTKSSSRAEGKCGKRLAAFISVVTMFYSVSYGVLVILSQGIETSSMTTYLTSLAVAGIVAISSGLCLAEYINNLSQEVSSIYSCCYQHSSEVLAFSIGWIWIVSQTAAISAVCKVLVIHVNDWTDDISRKYMENIFSDYAKDVPSLIFVLFFTFFVLTGFGETLIWYALFIPIAFVIVVSVYMIMSCVNSKMDDNFMVDNLTVDGIEGIDGVMSKSTLCLLFFSGPQNLPRVSPAHLPKNITAILGPLNGIALIIAFVFITTATLSDKFVSFSSANEILNLTSNILCTISLCSIGIEAFYPLHFIIEDMSSDGLLFRSFSKKWKPFCFPVSPVLVHVLVFISVGLMSIFMTLVELLKFAAVFPLLIGSIIPYLVLLHRYKNNSSWQYEPMFHTSKKTCNDRSRKQSEEFQYSHTPGFDITEDQDLSTACTDEIFSDSTSSDTDIDSVVQQYKDQDRISKISRLDESISSSQIPEPTPSSSFRAKICIGLHITISLILSLILSFVRVRDSFSVAIAALICIFLSTVVLSVLICFPQNQKFGKNRGCCSKVPSMPWIPGVASMASSSLLVHALRATWKVSLSCFLLGILLYFLYGINSSTAANSFYNMKTTRITLRPLPSYGNNCVPQIIPSQRKMSKSRKPKNLKTDKM